LPKKMPKEHRPQRRMTGQEQEAGIRRVIGGVNYSSVGLTEMALDRLGHWHWSNLRTKYTDAERSMGVCRLDGSDPFPSEQQRPILSARCRVKSVSYLN